MCGCPASSKELGETGQPGITILSMTLLATYVLVVTVVHVIYHIGRLRIFLTQFDSSHVDQEDILACSVALFKKAEMWHKLAVWTTDKTAQ